MKCPKCGYIIQSKQRTNPMNKYLWGTVYHLISEELGYLPEEVHELMKLKFNSKVIFVGKDEITIGLSTASLTISEFKQYVSKIVMFASFELSLIIPEPNDKSNMEIKP